MKQTKIESQQMQEYETERIVPRGKKKWDQDKNKL